MKHKQILEQMLSFSLDQHQLKDKQIEDLQQQNTELAKKLATYTDTQNAN